MDWCEPQVLLHCALTWQPWPHHGHAAWVCGAWAWLGGPPQTWPVGSSYPSGQQKMKVQTCSDHVRHFSNLFDICKVECQKLTVTGQMHYQSYPSKHPVPFPVYNPPHTHTCTYTHACMRTQTHTCAYTHACTHAHTHTHICTYMCGYTHTCTPTRTMCAVESHIM